MKFISASFIAAIVLSFFSCTQAHADLAMFDLTDPTNGDESAGEAFENDMPFTSNGVTITATTDSTFSGATGSSYSANGSGGGVNSAGTSDDGASVLDALETITFTVTFAAPVTALQLTEIDLSGVGATAADQATINVAGTSFDLFTGQPDFAGGSDTWTPSIAINSGDTIVFSAAEAYALNSITFHTTTAVPEPTAALMFGIALAGLGFRRRRS